MPIIQSTQEAEIGRITVQGQSKQKVSKAPISNNSWALWCMPVISALWEVWVEGSQSRPAWA
jgi:hypothetical protein